MPLMRSGLQRDDVTERLTQHSISEFRVWIAAGFLVLITAEILASVFMQGVAAVLGVCLTLVTLTVGVLRLRRERLLLRDYRTAVATVSDWKRTELEGGSLYEVKYRFLASDGKLYIGSSGACSRELPPEGETVPVLYRADNPNDNLTLATFWFYGFSYTGTE